MRRHGHVAKLVRFQGKVGNEQCLVQFRSTCFRYRVNVISSLVLIGSYWFEVLGSRFGLSQKQPVATRLDGTEKQRNACSQRQNIVFDADPFAVTNGKSRVMEDQTNDVCLLALAILSVDVTSLTESLFKNYRFGSNMFELERRGMRLSFLIQFSRREILRLFESTRRNYVHSRDWKTAMKPAMETAAMVDVTAPAYAWSKTPGKTCTNRRHRIQTDQATRVSTPVDLHPSVAGFSGLPMVCFFISFSSLPGSA